MQEKQAANDKLVEHLEKAAASIHSLSSSTDQTEQLKQENSDLKERLNKAIDEAS